MKQRKVKYKDGNNIKFNYYIIAEKEEITLNENSLAHQINTTSDKSFKIQFNGITGNADLLLIMKTKDDIFKAHIFCNYDDIEEI